MAKMSAIEELRTAANAAFANLTSLGKTPMGVRISIANDLSLAVQRVRSECVEWEKLVDCGKCGQKRSKP